MSSPIKSSNAVDPPPLEKIRKNTEDLTVGSDKENSNTDAKDSESIHSLTPPPPKHNGKEEDEEESEESSSDDEDNPLFDGLSAEDIKKLKQKMGSIQTNFKEHEKNESQRRIEDVQAVIDFNLSIQVSPELALFIDQFMVENHMDLSSKLQDEGAMFLESLQEMMEQEQQHTNDGGDQSDMDADDDGSASDFDPHGDEDKDDPDWAVAAKRRKAQSAAKRKDKNVTLNTNQDGKKRCGRLMLNDALKNIDDQSQWSDARKKAWSERQSRPNAYFYRFCVPGQPQKNGKWVADEHKLFMQRVLEIGANDSWGIFSKKIPGRVGYQCSNYWRMLVKDGDVRDPNYWYDGKKLHFKRNTKEFAISAEYRKFAITVVRDKGGVFTDLPCKHPKHPPSSYCKQVEVAMKDCDKKDKKNDANKKTRKRKKKDSDDDDEEDWNAQPKAKKRRKTARRKRDDSDDDGDDEAFYCKAPTSPTQNDEDCIEQLKDFVDIMTGMPIEKPAISPYGHVLGYETWTKVLRTSKHKNVCPFTLQKMTRRSLVKITKENYEEYKGKILNVTQEQAQLMSNIEE